MNMQEVKLGHAEESDTCLYSETDLFDIVPNESAQCWSSRVRN